MPEVPDSSDSDTDITTSPPGSHYAGQRDTGSFSTGHTDLSLQLLGVAGLGEATGWGLGDRFLVQPLPVKWVLLSPVDNVGTYSQRSSVICFRT